MTVYATTDTKKGRTGIAPTYLQTTPNGMSTSADSQKSYIAVEKAFVTLFSSNGKAKWRTYSAHFLLIS